MAKKNTLSGNDPEKIFVLDTSVILHDHKAIKNFQEHYVAIPIQVLEELDNFKKGNDTVNFEAREFIRFTESIAKDKLINDWIPLNGTKAGKFKVVLHNQYNDLDSEKVFENTKYDNKILNCAISLQFENKNSKIILVSKDICLRLKARALNIQAEDYKTGKIKDVKSILRGKLILENANDELIETLYSKGSADPSMMKDYVFENNQYAILRNNKKSVLAFYNPFSKQLERVNDQTAFGIDALNAEQNFALHALLNPNIKLLTLQGVAGTGKTLLALASAIEQRSGYRQIFVTRSIVALSNKDLGYLPGDVKAKLDPYMQSLWDNLNYIKDQFKITDKNYRRIEEMLQTEKIAIAPLPYIRGRSLLKIFFIIDEAQNLTPHEVKTIITRAGNDTKIIFMGDVNQIDTPYLDSQSNGLSYMIDRIKNNPICAHITLEKGERSELANIANEYL